MSLEQSQKAFKLDPQNIFTYKEKGLALNMVGDFSEAINNFDAYLSKDSRTA